MLIKFVTYACEATDYLAIASANIFAKDRGVLQFLVRNQYCYATTPNETIASLRLRAQALQSSYCRCKTQCFSKMTARRHRLAC